MFAEKTKFIVETDLAGICYGITVIIDGKGVVAVCTIGHPDLTLLQHCSTIAVCGFSQRTKYEFPFLP